MNIGSGIQVLKINLTIQSFEFSSSDVINVLRSIWIAVVIAKFLQKLLLLKIHVDHSAKFPQRIKNGNYQDRALSSNLVVQIFESEHNLIQQSEIEVYIGHK